MNTIQAKFLLTKNDTCYYCKQSVVYYNLKQGQTAPRNRKTVDHRVPVCRGGRNVLSNYVVACQKCNEEKGQLTDKEYLTVIRYRKWVSFRRALLPVLLIFLIPQYWYEIVLDMF